jgi:hypothetical protein
VDWLSGGIARPGGCTRVDVPFCACAISRSYKQGVCFLWALPLVAGKLCDRSVVAHQVLAVSQQGGLLESGPLGVWSARVVCGSVLLLSRGQLLGCFGETGQDHLEA